MSNLELTVAIDGENPVVGDLHLRNGQISLVSGREAVAQLLRNRLRFFLGEWFLDRRVGVPYWDEILIKNPNRAAIRSTLRRVILETPGVAAVERLSFDFDAQRIGSVTFTAVLETGEALEVGAALGIPEPPAPAPVEPLLRFADGDFARDTEASYQTGPASLAWAPRDVLRVEDRGDGHGPLALFEGPSENLLANPERFDLWDFASNITPIVDATPGPDDGAFADRLDFTSAAASAQIRDVFSIASSVPYAFSLWVRAVLASKGFRLRSANKDGVNPSVANLLAFGEWRRFAQSFDDSGAGVSTPLAILTNPSTGGTLDDLYAWGAQLEALPFATSLIRNGAPRAADLLTFGANPTLSGGRWEFDFCPEFDSDDYSSGSFFLYSLRGAGVNNQGVFINFGGSGARIQVSDGGVGAKTLELVSFEKNQKCTVSVDWDAGQTVLSGFTSGDGTNNWTPDGVTPVTHLNVGSRGSFNDLPFYGRISEPRPW